MNPDQSPFVLLATELPDEAAVALVELLESHYAGQIHRHYQSERDDRPVEIGNDHDPPF
jgi:hypothetical protein